jgi:hypothetical protein
MVKTRVVEEEQPTGRMTPNAKRKPKQTRMGQGVAKPRQSRCRSTLLKAAKKVADKPKAVRRRSRRVRIGEELEALTMENMRAASKAKKNQQETGRVPWH